MAAGNETSVGLPVFGLPGHDFYILHSLALCSLGLSIIASTFVLVYLLFFASNKPVRRRQIGERLVVYLAIYDLCFSISHSLDHSYMMATLSNPPDYICVPFAFLLHQFIMAQSLLVLFTSVNAMTMVVLKRKLDLGHNDWKLFLITLGVPASAGVVGVSVPYLGPSGSCENLQDERTYNVAKSLEKHTRITVHKIRAAKHTKEWVQCLKLCTAIGDQGLLRRVRNFKFCQLHPSIAAQALWILSRYSLDEVRKQSAVVANFYSWTKGIAEQLKMVYPESKYACQRDTEADDM
ncbi:hypothetical protein CAPTEDRAFT_212406 [Capitella teleta]|uniref:Uncharacterized protein n=1 Tax=Capitella teleta TaxID=283909 RepID=R7TWS6_CAPTE|nr:hypothetical protein CAPTEDRAFT_212406 [Capitella teleta]|eukprot:ELT98199.1 hypothetical protein CAPTEDRAFT_212406 [Capitella teleta]